MPLSHLLEYFAGIPYWKKGERKKERERGNLEIGKYEKLGLSHLLEYFAGVAYWKKKERGRKRGGENIWKLRNTKSCP